MPNYFELKDRYIYTRFAGENLDLESVTRWVLEFVEHADFRRGSNVLWDATAVVTANLSFGDMQNFGDFLLTIRDRRGGGRSGFVTNNDLIFGLFRIHEMLNQDKFDYDYRVFRDLDIARTWVMGGETERCA
jgi:hypothetical protein